LTFPYHHPFRFSKIYLGQQADHRLESYPLKSFSIVFTFKKSCTYDNNKNVAAIEIMAMATITMEITAMPTTVMAKMATEMTVINISYGS